MIGQRLLLLAGILLGFALRLHRLGAESLWYDETVSVHLARKSIADMIAHTAGDIHPPGYYLLLHLWGQLTTPTLAHGLEFLYAWPSLFAGVLLLALIYALGGRLFDAPTALIGVWLAAVSPFQLWYSQEVRMYTVGAALALLCLWAVLRFVDRRNPLRWLVLYALAAAAGMYTLYYFAFWLVGVNVVVLWLLWRDKQRTRRIAAWLGAQVGALLLFAPWLPIFVRQAIDPPVPPWRTPWDSTAALRTSLTETLAALTVGQSPPGEILWPWALLVVITLISALLFGHTRDTKTQIGIVVVGLAVTLPILQLFLLTLFATPVYHIRYVFLYAPLFVLVPAVTVNALWSRSRLTATTLLLLWLAASLAALDSFWTEPRYRADDHRAAVATIAAQWRPGDVLLANAGWTYPVLTLYWPTELVGVEGVVPLKISDLSPVDDYAQKIGRNPNLLTSPSIARSGSVDGPSNLGWGNPTSDFFALSTTDTLDSLAAIAGHSQRIWHYRLYDTVSDPNGIIRRWLGENMTMLTETTIPGRDFGAIQLFATKTPPPMSALSEHTSVCFGDLVCLFDYAQSREIEAGTVLYLPQRWQATQPLPELAVSLRIYDHGGHLAAQLDVPLSPPAATWQTGETRLQSFALPVSVSTKPGNYSLEAVVYRSDTGEALPLPHDAPSPDGQRLQLGSVMVKPASRIPTLPAVLASFDYIDLLEARFDHTTATAGETLRTAFYWRPRPNSYRDDYSVVLTMKNSADEIAHEWRFPLGGDYPSGVWLPSLPVRDFYDLTLPERLASGEYTVAAELRRTSDNKPLAVRRGWLPAQPPIVATLQIEAE